MSFILALDQGTTSSRAMIFDDHGQVRARAQREFRQIFPAPDRVEHDAEEIRDSQLAVAEEALSNAGIDAGSVRGVGIGNQRETVVVWDRKTGTPISNAIVWQDRRTTAECRRLSRAGHDALIQERTGLLIDPYFSASKLAWILEHVPGARDRAADGALAFGTIDSWLAYGLTAGREHVTDASNASRTMLYNIHTGDWDDELLALFDIPRALLPRVVPSSGVVGEITVGSLAGVPIAGIAGDQQAALFGQLCHGPGLAKNTYGTGCFLLMNTGATPVVSRNRLLTTVAWQTENERAYALEGSVFMGGAVVQWLRDGLKVISEASEVEKLAQSVPDSGGVTLVPAFAGLGAPYWDPTARGAIFGLTRGVTAAHLARAAIEGIAFQVADLLDAMQDDASQDDAALELSELRVDGGAARNDGLLQFQADILQRPVVRPSQTESTALGVAYLAGLAVGVWEDRKALGSCPREESRFDPGMPAAQAGELRQRWSRAVERSRNWVEIDETDGVH